MLIADTNQFHPLIDGKAYAAGHAADGSAYSVVILRATYSTTLVDTGYVSSLMQARAAGLYVGHYGYMVASVDAGSQGTFFGQTVKANGGLKSGDAIWCDDEEADSAGTHAQQFLAAAHLVLGDVTADEGVYSGADFWTANIGSVPSGEHRWIAAYGTTTQPADADLWQFTDAQTMPGVSGACDCSIYTGTLDQYLAMLGVGGVSVAPVVTPVVPVPTPAPVPDPAPKPAPAPVPAAQRNVYTPLAVDGAPVWPIAEVVVYQTVRALQFVVFNGDNADVDGKFGPATAHALQAHLGVAQDGVVGPLTVRALQSRVGASVDGDWGPLTTEALQRALNAGKF